MEEDEEEGVSGKKGGGVEREVGGGKEIEGDGKAKREGEIEVNEVALEERG